MQKRRITIGTGLLAGAIVLACASEAMDQVAMGQVGEDGMALIERWVVP